MLYVIFVVVVRKSLLLKTRVSTVIIIPIMDIWLNFRVSYTLFVVVSAYSCEPIGGYTYIYFPFHFGQVYDTFL